MSDRPYTVARLAERWDCGETFVREEIRRGRLAACRYGTKLIRIPVEAVVTYETAAAFHVADARPTVASRSAAALGRQIRAPRFRAS